MSALGAVPGYAYPSFDYGQSQLLSLTLPNVNVDASNPFVTTIIKAGGGYATYLRGATMRYLANAAVANRTIDFVIMDGSGIVIDQIRTLTVVTASGALSSVWNERISIAYTISGPLDYNPISGVVMPPGYSAAYRVFGNQAGDQFVSLAAYGIQIPTVGTVREDAVTATPRVV